MKKLLKWILRVVAVVLIALVAFLGTVLATNYYPKDVEGLKILHGNQTDSLQTDTPYSIMTYNTGYAGLGKKQDFFMDGGKNSGAFSVTEVEQNSKAILRTIMQQNTDFVFLQEVDKSGKRSKNVNQYDLYVQEQYYDVFAINYKTLFVPIPITNPMGGVHSGIMTQSRIKPTSSERYSFNGKESFLVQMFELNRCFSVTRIPVNGKELVLINAHFSAFDKGGKIREQQLAQMVSFLNTEYELGNYVILGGDFNHELPGTDANDFTWTVAVPDWIQKFPVDLDLDGYQWAVDPTTPSVRSNEVSYTKGVNYVAVVDGFLISDNIEILDTKTLDLSFEHSDHNPVVLNFKLK